MAGIRVHDAGIGVQHRPDSAFSFGRNRCSACSGARTEDVAFHRETASLVVGEAQSPGTVHGAEDAILLDQVVNDRLLVSIDPAGEQAGGRK